MTPAAPKPQPAVRFAGAALLERNGKIDSRDQQRCARCGEFITNNGSRHHRKFKSRGGGDEVSNGILLCGSGTTGCHGWVHANPGAAARVGFAVWKHESPRLVPVMHAIHGRVYLDDEGGYSTRKPAAA